MLFMLLKVEANMGKYFKTYFSPKGGAADHIIGFIDRTKETLDIAVYSITHDGIAQAIIRAKNRGVKIRILTDALQAKGADSDDELFESAGVPLRRDTQPGLMHHKFAISDNFAIGLGSFNWSINADKRNMENWNVCRLQYVIEDYNKEFEKLWELNKPKIHSLESDNTSK
jgi:phosphatidylserine/phosphatidylglycerophosphate/cardiolipin synthase-like enzyme